MGFSKLSDILDHIRKNYPPLSKRIDESQVLTGWSTAVGALIAKHAHPLKLEKGVLHVQVEHAAWRSELHHRQHQILKKLNAGLDQEEWLIRELQFIEPAKKRAARPISTSSKEHRGKKR